jgi:hypothetical protein
MAARASLVHIKTAPTKTSQQFLVVTPHDMSLAKLPVKLINSICAECGLFASYKPPAHSDFGRRFQPSVYVSYRYILKGWSQASSGTTDL